MGAGQYTFNDTGAAELRGMAQLKQEVTEPQQTAQLIYTEWIRLERYRIKEDQYLYREAQIAEDRG